MASVINFGEIRVQCQECFAPSFCVIHLPCAMEDMVFACTNAECKSCGSRELKLIEARAEDNKGHYPLDYHIEGQCGGETFSLDETKK